MGQIIELSAGAGTPGPAGPPGSSGALRLAFAGAGGVRGNAYSAALIATGGVPAYTFAISVGVLPAGLSLNPGTGAITGTPSAVGTVTVKGRVTDSSASTATVSCIFVISEGTPDQPHAVLLTEPSLFENRLLWSEDLTQLGWACYGGAITGPHTFSGAGGDIVRDAANSAVSAGQMVTYSALLSGTGDAQFQLLAYSPTEAAGAPPVIHLTATPTWYSFSAAFPNAHSFVVFVLINLSGPAITVGATQVNLGPVPAPYVLTTTAPIVTSPRTLKLSDQTTYTTLQAVVQEAAAGVLGTKLTLQLSFDNGATWGYTVGEYLPDRVHMDGTATYYQTTIPIPDFFVKTTSQSIRARAWASNTYADPGTPAAVVSSTLVVSPIGAPSATGATISLGPVMPRLDPSSGAQYWEQSITVQTPGAADPNCWAYQVTVQQVNPMGIPNVGDPYGLELPDLPDFANDGAAHTVTLQRDYVPVGALNNCTLWKVYGFSRSATTPWAWQDPTFATLQQWPAGGATSYLQGFGAMDTPIVLGSTIGPNLLTNPGFEGRTLSLVWKILEDITVGSGSSFYPDVSGFRSGSQGLTINGIYTAGSEIYAIQGLPSVIAGRSYSYAIWVNAEAGSLSDFQLIANCYDITHSPIGSFTVVAGATHPITPGWRKVTGVILMPAGTVTADFVLRLQTNGGTANIHFDDAEVYLLPGLSATLRLVDDLIDVALRGIGTAYIGDNAVTAAKTGLAAIDAASGALSAGASVTNLQQNGGSLSVNNGINVFTGPVYLSQGNTKPVVALLNTGIFLYKDATATHLGSTAAPYVAIQASGVLAAASATGPAVFIAAAGSVGIYAVSGSTADPYLLMDANLITIKGKISGANYFTTTISAAQIQMLYSGGVSLTLDAAKVKLLNGSYSLVARSTDVTIYSVDGVFTSPYMVLSAGGVTIANSFGGANNYSVNIAATGIQMVYNGVAYITLNTAGMAMVGGTFSLNQNTITTSITNQTIGGVAFSAGVQVKSNVGATYPGTFAVLTPAEMGLFNSATPAVAFASLYHNGVSGELRVYYLGGLPTYFNYTRVSPGLVTLSDGFTSSTADITATGVFFQGVKVLTTRQTGPGNTTDVTDVATRFNSLLASLRTHGMIT